MLAATYANGDQATPAREKALDLGYLDGKAVAVTGSGGGLGRAYAQHAAAEGAAVLVNDVDPSLAQRVAVEITHDGGRAVPHCESIATWEGATSMVAACLQAFGRIDGLVNNAGVLALHKAWDADEESIRRLVEVNVLGTLFCGTAALSKMVAQRGGSIVNITSGAVVGQSDGSIYSATKGAVLSATYAWALEAREVGVRVNAVAPLGKTRGMTEPFRAYSGIDLKSPPPSRVAPLVSFLLSDRSGHVTGQFLRFDGIALSIISRPKVGITARREQWTLDDVAAATESDLSPGFQPVGVPLQP